MRPLLWAKPSGRSVRVSFHQAKKPPPLPRSKTGTPMTHTLRFLVRWRPLPPPPGVAAGPGGAGALCNLLLGGRLLAGLRLGLLRLGAHVRLPFLLAPRPSSTGRRGGRLPSGHSSIGRPLPAERVILLYGTGQAQLPHPFLVGAHATAEGSAAVIGHKPKASTVPKRFGRSFQQQ